MTTQSGFILSRFDVYSVAKCIITVKFLISKFAHFDSMKVSNDHHAQHHRRRRRHRWQQSQRTSTFSCIHRNNDHPNFIAQRFHPVSDYCSDKIEAFCTKFISVMLMEYKDATQQKKNDGGPETKYWTQKRDMAKKSALARGCDNITMLLMWKALSLSLCQSWAKHNCISFNVLQIVFEANSWNADVHGIKRLPVGLNGCTRTDNMTRVVCLFVVAVIVVVVVVKWNWDMCETCLSLIGIDVNTKRALRLISNLGHKRIRHKQYPINKVFVLCHQTFYFELELSPCVLLEMLLCWWWWVFVPSSLRHPFHDFPHAISNKANYHMDTHETTVKGSVSFLKHWHYYYFVRDKLRLTTKLLPNKKRTIF